MSGENEIECIGVCQTDDFGYCIGCGRRLEAPVVEQAPPADTKTANSPPSETPSAPTP